LQVRVPRLRPSPLEPAVKGRRQSRKQVETARILTATVLASVTPEVPASMGQTLADATAILILT
jgi:hypothetical protein